MPDDAVFRVVCPCCGVESSVDLRRLAADFSLDNARAFARLPEAAAHFAPLQGPEVAAPLLGALLAIGRTGTAERADREKP